MCYTLHKNRRAFTQVALGKVFEKVVARMSYAVVHMQKFSKGSIRGIQSHNQRERESKTNPDIDYDKSKDNYDLINESAINYNKKINEIIETYRVGTKAVRKDAVVLCNFIVTSDQEFFKNMDAAQQKKFFRDSLDFFGQRYGQNHVVSAMVHMDEATPHMHLGIVPLTSDGRLSAKAIFTKKELRELQTDFVEKVGAGYGLSRGVEGSERTHLTEQQFKMEKAREKEQEISAEVQKSTLKYTQIRQEMQKLQEQKSILEKNISQLKHLPLNYNQINGIGEEHGLVKKKVTMSVEEAERLKEQAKAYHGVKVQNDNLERALEHYKSLTKDVPRLQEQSFKLSQQVKAQDKKIKKIGEVIKSSPELQKMFNDQAMELAKAEKQRKTVTRNRNGLER